MLKETRRNENTNEALLEQFNRPFLLFRVLLPALLRTFCRVAPGSLSSPDGLSVLKSVANETGFSRLQKQEFTVNVRGAAEFLAHAYGTKPNRQSKVINASYIRL